LGQISIIFWWTESANFHKRYSHSTAAVKAGNKAFMDLIDYYKVLCSKRDSIFLQRSLNNFHVTCTDETKPTKSNE